MSWKYYLLFGSLGLLVLIPIALLQTAPGYMDAEYYYAMGLRIARDKSLLEPFIWNYLNGFYSLPQPAFTFWMPLPSFLAALSMALTGLQSFTGAKIGFMAVFVFVPPLTMKIAYDLTGEEKTAKLAGIVSLFPVFYSSFLGTTDSFGVLMVFGSVFFLQIRKEEGLWKYIFLGMIAGLIHLTRADGLLWFAVAFFYVLSKQEKTIKAVSLLVAGYLCVMAPWFVRNWFVLGEIMPPGASRMLWLTEYNDLFTFEPHKLTFINWYEQGLNKVLRDLFGALGTNIKTALIVQGQIILVPLIGIGIKKNWKDWGVRSAVFIWGLIFIVMTLVFPFAGSRGGLFHSGAALQPILWALAVVGLMDFITWGVNQRGWIKKQAELVLGLGLTLFLAGMTLFIVQDRVIGRDISQPKWNQSYGEHLEIGKELNQLGIGVESLIMINNPPGLYIATDRPSVVIPNGGVDTLIRSAEELGAEMLILEANHPDALDYLYSEPQKENKLEYIQTVSYVHYFKFYKTKE
jgi:hypothetical protein